MVKHQNTELDSVFSALGDATRRAILARLATDGECRVSELAAPHRMSLPAVSKHLSVLESAGLIAKQKDGRVVHCRLEPAPLKRAADWVEQYRAFWDEQFDRLAAYLETNKPNEEGKIDE